MRISSAVIVALAFQVPTAADLSTVRTVSATTPREVQIALAQAAGPVGAQATVFILGRHGYEKAQDGSNGFTCLVQRPDFNTMAPQCFDAAGTASTVKVLFFQEEERAKGVPESEITAAVAEGYRKGTFVAPARPGIVYMLSDYNYLPDPDPAAHKIVHFPGHLMFYAPYLTSKEIGDGAGAPFLTDPGKADNLLVVIPAASHPH